MTTSEGVHPTGDEQERGRRCFVLVRGLGDVASATAHRLFRDGYAVAIHNGPDPPKTHRRRMAFADAFFDAEAVLDGLTARRCDDTRCLFEILKARPFLPVLVADLEFCRSIYQWDVLVDARMQKRVAPECQRGMAALTIGLGPGHAAGRTADIAIETKWGDRLGAIIREGSTLPLAGEPRAIEGVGRERNVYAPVAGILRSDRAIGDPVEADAVIGTIDGAPIRAPLSGTLRGLARPGIAVLLNDKIVEVDPREPQRAGSCGLGERPRRIAKGVAVAVEEWAKGMRDVRAS